MASVSSPVKGTGSSHTTHGREMASRKWGAIVFSGGSFAHPTLPALVVRDGQEVLPPPSAVSAHGITLGLPGPGSAGFDWITTAAYPRRLPPTPVPFAGPTLGVQCTESPLSWPCPWVGWRFIALLTQMSFWSGNLAAAIHQPLQMSRLDLGLLTFSGPPSLPLRFLQLPGGESGGVGA